MTQTQQPEVLWLHRNGEISCVRHGGGYLESEARAHPCRTKHDTPLGTWTRISGPLALAFREDGPPSPTCETCGVPADLSK